MKKECPGCGRRVKTEKIKCPDCGELAAFLFKCRRCGRLVRSVEDVSIASELGKALGFNVDCEFVPGLAVERSPEWENIGDGFYQNKRDPNKIAFKAARG